MKYIFILLLLSSFSVLATSSFIDSYGRVHDVAVNEKGDPSSDNGWFYSAIYTKLGGKLNIKKENALYCAENLRRQPLGTVNREDIPISRDEILGLIYLRYLKKEHLDGWSFSPIKSEKFNLIKLFKEALELVESWHPFQLKHRTYFWKNGLNQIANIAFLVPLQDRHFILTQWGEYHLFYHVVHELDSFFQPEDRSSRQIRFLKTGKDPQSVLNYYRDSEHPSVVSVKNLMVRDNIKK